MQIWDSELLQAEFNLANGFTGKVGTMCVLAFSLFNHRGVGGRMVYAKRRKAITCTFKMTKWSDTWMHPRVFATCKKELVFWSEVQGVVGI